MNGRLSPFAECFFCYTDKGGVEALSIAYCFKSSSAHKRCSGFDLGGWWTSNISQTTTHTIGDVPKKALNFLYPTLILPSLLCLEICWPRCQNIFTEAIDKRKQHARNRHTLISFDFMQNFGCCQTFAFYGNK